MPYLEVELPDDLYREVETRNSPVSELLQDAVQSELHRRTRAAELDVYIAELIAEVGMPNDAKMARAEDLAERIAAYRARER